MLRIPHTFEHDFISAHPADYPAICQTYYAQLLPCDPARAARKRWQVVDCGHRSHQIGATRGTRLLVGIIESDPAMRFVRLFLVWGGHIIQSRRFHTAEEARAHAVRFQFTGERGAVAS